ncbi:MAG: substrate-binding protein [Acetobacteraceae bacterium]|nr:substrate-binding protein [Acetobacteraceae bacterium]
MMQGGPKSISRRTLLGTGAMLGVAAAGLRPAWSADESPIGTFPAGTQGDSVFFGLGCESTGPYSAQGGDMLKGYELAIKHLNENNGLITSITGASKPGILGKKVTYQNADTASNPNNAVQAFSRFISQNKAIMISGSVSSAVAIAAQKLGDREKVIYLAGISGSNETTGVDCQRYGFRACHFAYTAAAALAPVLAKELGTTRKVAYLVPDYTYGRTVLASMKKFTEAKGWKTVTEQLCPLGSTDYSSYLLNMMASGADTLVNICFGADAVNSTKQAAQFGALKQMKLVMPYAAPFFANEVGPDIMEGVYGTTEFWWTLEDHNDKAKQFVTEFNKAYNYKPEWGAHIAYLQTALYARAVEKAGTFRPVEVIKEYEKGEKIDTTIGEVYWRASDHQLVRPVYVIKGKAKKDMKSKDDYYDIVATVPGEQVMPPEGELGCKLGSYT